MQEGHSIKDTFVAAVPRARLARAGLALAVAIVAALALGLAAAPWAHAAWPTRPPTTKRGIDKIKHVVIIMQENRSFDHYFGTFPGANGLPRKDGRFTVCVPDPLKGRCQRPYHDSSTRDQGGPHGMKNAIADINGGRMDGFIREAQKTCTPSCFPPTDVMGYHDAREIPNYWKYAKHFVLQDRMFEPAASWTTNR